MRKEAENRALRAYISNCIKQAEAIAAIVDERLEARWRRERRPG